MRLTASMSVLVLLASCGGLKSYGIGDSVDTDLSGTTDQGPTDEGAGDTDPVVDTDVEDTSVPTDTDGTSGSGGGLGTTWVVQTPWQAAGMALEGRPDFAVVAG